MGLLWWEIAKSSAVVPITTLLTLDGLLVFTPNCPKMGSKMHPVKRVGQYKIRGKQNMISSKMDNNEAAGTTNHSDFSIDHILNRAGNNKNSTQVSLDPFSWLQCTRYCPPKVPRAQRREGPQKRQLGRHPRIPFTSHQLSMLENKFQQSPYLSSEEVTVLSRKLQLADVRVKIWFQNRRARERREKSLSQSLDGENKESKSDNLEGSVMIKQESTSTADNCDYNFLGCSTSGIYQSYFPVVPSNVTQYISSLNLHLPGSPEK